MITVSSSHTTIRLVLPSVHPRDQQVSARLLKWRRDAEPLIEMAGRGFQVEVPSGHRTTQILSLVPSDQASADVAQIGFLPVDLFRTGRNVIFDIRQQLVDEDLVRFKLDAPAVAKAEIDRRSAARRLGHLGLELPPGLADLVEVLLLPAVIPSPHGAQGFVPGIARPGRAGGDFRRS